MSTPATPTVASTPGMQVLLDAEKEANRQVQAARQYRVQRLKDARSEAQSEIESLKKMKHNEYLAFEQSVLGSLENTVQEYAKGTETKLEEVRKSAEEKKNEMVKMLVEAVCKVEPKIHSNSVLRTKEGN